MSPLLGTSSLLDTPPVLQAAFAVMVLACMFTWGIAVSRVRGGNELVRWSDRRPVPWGLVDVIAGFILLGMFEIAALQFLELPSGRLQDLSPDLQFRALLVQATARVGAAATMVLVLIIRHAKNYDVGFVAKEAWGDVRLGVTAFAMVFPPVYLLLYGLSQFFPDADHPIIVAVQMSPSIKLFGAACVTAVIAAPLVEELYFRMVFQGWLENFSLQRTENLFIGSSVDWEPREAGWTETRVSRVEDRPRLWPVFVSAALFAALHLQPDKASPDPIVLFFFAIAQGFIYQRTHRILPCIVMHVLLNAVGMIVLASSIWEKL